MIAAPSTKRARMSDSDHVAGEGDHDADAISSIVVVDDPCWGSPTTCSLSHLLPQLDRSKTILYESDDYIALDKPPDLRMDGDYPATVHKLLTFWYPPQHLLHRLQQEQQQQQSPESTCASSPDDNNEEKQQQQQRLLQLISQMHQHNKHDPDCLRPCHQLDYATSGLLLIARNKHAANRARLAFEQRLAKKSYVALVHEHVHFLPDNTLPVLTRRQLETSMQQLESLYRSTKNKRRKDTWNGFQPPHAMFQKWQQQKAQQQQQHRRNKQEKSDNTGQKHKDILTENEWKVVWESLQLDPADATMLLPLTWNDVKQAQKTSHFERAANVYNDLAKSKQTNTAKDQANLPTIFRVKEEDEEEEAQADCVYIFASMAQSETEFAMIVHSDHQPQTTTTTAATSSNLQFSSSTLLDFKPALTQCLVQSRTLLHGDSVSQVVLVPLTGRRHQLRVHMTLLGHAIVGDQTYYPTTTSASSSSSSSSSSAAAASSSSSSSAAAAEVVAAAAAAAKESLTERMCLHSMRLELPVLLSKEGATNTSKNNGVLTVESKSPFEETQDGIILVHKV
jgi:23S rRNA-/tRNA-specific pseudouridylate synthase